MGSSNPMAKPHDWRGFDAAFPKRPDGTERSPAAATQSFAEMFGPSQSGAPLAPVAVNPSQAPQINARPSTTTGGGVSTRTPAPVDRAAAASAASPAPFFPDPSRRYVGPARNVNDSNFTASQAVNRDIASNPSAYVTGGQPRPGATPRTAVASSNWFDAPADDARIQRLLDTAAGITRPDPNVYAGTPADAAKIAMNPLYSGDAATRLSGGRIQQNPTPGTVSYAGDGSGMPKNVAPAAVTPATTAANYAGQRFETQASPAVGVDKPVAPAVASVNDKPATAEWFGPARPASPAVSSLGLGPERGIQAAGSWISDNFTLDQFGVPKMKPKPADNTAATTGGQAVASVGNVGAAGAVNPARPRLTQPVARTAAPEQFGPPSPWWEEQQKRNRTASAY